jgi:ADP-heptose:LPS heptosyltransferase
MPKGPPLPIPTTRVSRRLKLLDRFVGIPLTLPFAFAPKQRVFDPARVRRIGLMKTAAIGDTLLLAGLLDDVRRTYPGSTLVIITGPDNKQAAELLPGRADEQIVVAPSNPFAAVRAIRAAKLDVIVDFGSWPRFDALLAAFSGADFRLGFETANQFRHYGFDRSVPHSSSVHERENYRRLLSDIDVDAVTTPSITAPGVLPPDRFPPRPYVVFHPSSGGFMGHVKEWSVDRWADLGKRLEGRHWHVVVTGSARDKPKTDPLIERLRLANVSATNAAGSYNLGETADVLAASEVVVTVNTGLMHLAAQVGARTISLEGPTPLHRWGPLGPRARSVVTTLPGCGYLDLGFEYAGQRLDCMDGITVDAVVEAIDTLLASS